MKSAPDFGDVPPKKNPFDVTATIHLTEEAAACLWANETWNGKVPKSLSEIVGSLAMESANSYRKAFPSEVAQAVADFNRLHNC